MAPLVDPGTDCEDELPIPAGPPAEVGHEMDSELEKVFIDVVSLPTMVTPVCDMDGALRVPQAECPVIAMSAFVIQPFMATSPAGPKALLRAVHGRQPFPSSAIQQVMPSYRVRRVSHYMMAMGLWRPPVDTGIQTPLPSAACNACTSCQDCFPEVPM